MLEGISIVQLTPAGLLLLAILMILTGRIVPRATYQEKIKEADQWREAYELERIARSKSDAQTRELFEVAKTSKSMLEAVYEKSVEIKSGDA